ncbi:MAG: nodulation protein NfeD [Rhodospirillales bacterium]|nr:nodulation protein NfeD [Rhodospirillales bacterium]
MKPSDNRHCERSEAIQHCSKRLLDCFVALLLAMTILFSDIAAFAQEPAERPVYVLTMDGAIGPALSGYLDTGLAKAAEDNAQLLVIELNTPGGLLSTTRDMATSIVESKIPVAVWVTPSGAHAASAGTFILYAAHIAAMDEGTNVGAATPIEMKGQTGGQVGKALDDGKTDEESLKEILKEFTDPNAKAMRQKAIEDTTAFIRGLAELRGRNAEWAEKAVIEADSITASEALEKNVIDLIAKNREELLDKIDGKDIPVKNAASVTLQTKGAPVVEFAPDWKTRLLIMITDPNVALILMSIGVYGLILEFYNPGALVPGTIGAICLIIGLYALNVLPINAAGVALMLLGMIFMAAEAFMPSFGVMGLGGLVAFIVGATVMFEMESMPGMVLNWEVVAGVAFSGLLLIALVTYLTVKVYRKRASTGPESLVGHDALIEEWDDKHGRVRIQGEVWQAVSNDTLELNKGDTVLVSAVDGLTLKIQAAP